MGIEMKTKLRLRLEKEEFQRNAFKKALRDSKLQQKADDIGTEKRKEAKFLAKYLNVSLNDYRIIRQPSDYHTNSYNLGRQIIGLIDHLFVRYPVPAFLYRSVLNREGNRLVFGKTDDSLDDKWLDIERIYQDWFMTVAQGHSIAEATKSRLNRKESHWFLRSPNDNSTPQNLFWAKCAAAGIPGSTCQFLTERLIRKGGTSFRDPRQDDLIRFYANEHPHMRPNDLQEITDFVREMLGEPDFSFKKRTFASMLRLSDDWHRMVHGRKVKEFRSWRAIFEPWSEKREGWTVRAFELANNRALRDEGAKQRHCVFIYTSCCIADRSRIVSIRWYALDVEDPARRLTIEVDRQSREICQIRGRLNRRVTEEEMKAVRSWAGTNGLRISPWA